LAMEAADRMMEETDLATVTSNSAMEAADGAMEETDSPTILSNSTTGMTNPTHARPTRHAWTTCTTSRVLEDSTTDHRPVVTEIASGGAQKSLVQLRRRPFKVIRREALETALESASDWSVIYSIKDVEKVHKLIVNGIVTALDVVAPVKEITVKAGSSLYLLRETIDTMKRRDSARPGTPRFCVLRNASNHLVKRDKLTSNSETLAKSSSDPRVLWQLANDALGKALASLPPALVNAEGT
jgi:hypothetical protein